MVGKFWHLGQRRKKLLFEALALSLYARVIDAFPKKKIRPVQLSGLQDPEVLGDIAWAIRVSNKYVPWQNVCRHQALAAVILCTKYGQALEVFVGFRKNPETGRMEGHTWSMTNARFITGRCKVEEYTLQESRI